MRIRTADILLAKQTLYQLSYTPFVLGRGEKVKYDGKKIGLRAACFLSRAALFLVVFRC